MVYVYDYKTQTSLWISGAAEKTKANSELMAKVSLRRLENCQYAMSLSEVSLKSDNRVQLNEQESLISKLTSTPAGFRINSLGQIESSIMYSSGDDAWSRNIKRGIISSFQFSNQDGLSEMEETDIFGKCPTVYSLNKEADNSLSINRKKNLNNCDSVQNLMFSTNEIECNTEFYENKLLNHVECRQTLSEASEKGMKTVVEQSLKFNSKITVRNLENLGVFFLFGLKFALMKN
jgi:hypothetical protein